VLLFVTVLVDIRTNRIPNLVLILLAIFQFFSIYFSLTTIDGTFALKNIGSRCLTVFFIFIFLYVFFSIGGIGAGDLKLLILLAAGVERPIEFVATVFVIGAVFSVIHMVKNRNMNERMQVLCKYLQQVLKEGKPIPYYSVEPHIGEKMRHSIHLSVPIFIAYAFYGFLKWLQYSGLSIGGC